MPLIPLTHPVQPCRSLPADYLRNNTPVFTTKGVEIVPFVDPCMTSGQIRVGCQGKGGTWLTRLERLLYAAVLYALPPP